MRAIPLLKQLLFCSWWQIVSIYPVIAASSVEKSITPHQKGYALSDSLVEPVRGIWITNVASDALRSREQIQQTVQRCKEYGFTHLFVVVWNGGYTLYPSRVQKRHIGILQHPDFAGRDPLREMVEEAHAQGLKVHAWFEFGFSYAYRDSNNRWSERYPEWLGRNQKGEWLQKNGFFWWNALHPGPQELLQSLVCEVVKKYEVDGVQGDDRLPAMPAEGGYDPYTLQLYATTHAGQRPPTNPKEKQWLQWRADQLSRYAQSIYRAVKLIRPNCMVSWAPSIYPWCKEEYLQDWPAWLEGGYADMIFPQLYRYNSQAYEMILQQLHLQVPLSRRGQVYPGILTSLGDGYQASESLMREFIDLNRRYGFRGEVFFYYETLHRLPSSIYKNQ